MKSYHLFEVYGIELEYMLVNQSNLKVVPMVDELLTLKNGSLTSDIENGDIAWSNELVAHVLELKTNGPKRNLEGLHKRFHNNIVEINDLLKPFGTRLLSTAAHPLMNPVTDAQLWKHDYHEVYELYHQIFNCKRHGWSNVQSVHINLPFFNDKEFEKLHAAIRVLLPLIPGLCASSPIIEGKITAFKDTRLEYYKTNQREIPELTGLVIPERVFSRKDYETTIFDPIRKSMVTYDLKSVLNPYFLNSRGAIARFDRQAIEIRLMDIQECPLADIALCDFMIAVLKLLISKTTASLQAQKKWLKQDLLDLLNPIIKDAETFKISNMEYLELFGIEHPMTVQEVWKHLYELVKTSIDESHKMVIEYVLNNGTLATRILKAIGNDLSEKHIIKIYSKLANCLQENSLFEP